MPRIATALLALWSAAALAQAPALVQEPQPADPKKNQKVERIHVEDSAVKIDETRYAGQTESVTVQPKDGLPAYELLPSNASRERLDDPRRAAGGADRVWNVFRF